jgi:hypothetical protein
VADGQVLVWTFVPTSLNASAESARRLLAVLRGALLILLDGEHPTEVCLAGIPTRPRATALNSIVSSLR